jgi:putative heme iron utilization protein
MIARHLRPHEHRPDRENMMGKRTSSAKKLNKEPTGNGSSVNQQILATLKEIRKKLDDIATISDVMLGDKLDAILDELKAQRSESSEEGEDR